MAGSTAAAVDHAGAGPSLRGLWQAPVFVLGVAALATAALLRPLLAANESAAPLKRDLAEARRLLEKPDGDVEQAAKLVQRVLDIKGQHPDLAGQADLLFGTVRMRQALKTEGSTPTELWTEARQHFEAAVSEGVPESDKAHLQFRLGVAGFNTHDSLDHVITSITTTLDQSDERVLGYTVLTQAYLQCTPPNLAAALAANLKLRNLQEATEEVLAPARLLGGELDLRLNKGDEARRVLENLGPMATPEMKAKARRLCARSYQSQNRWQEAAKLWEQALADGLQKGEALYNLGVCAQHQDQNADAVRYWDQCVQSGGDEGRAAALALAEARLKGPNPDAAVEMFARVVDGVKRGDAWPGQLTDRAAVVKLFQDAGKAYVESRQFDAAVRLAEPFAVVAPPGEADVLRGKASSEWARSRRDEAKQAVGDAKKAAQEQARQLFLQAAVAYAAAAQQAPNDPVPGEYLWHSARCSWEGRDLEQASAKLTQVVNRPATPEEQQQDWYVQRQGEACYLLGEVRRALNDTDGANAAYRDCIAKQTSFAYRARYRLACAAAASGNLDDARDELEQNLKILHTVDRDPEAEEQTLFALGDIYYRSGKYDKVVQKVGGRVQGFPQTPDGTRAHFELADSYRHVAEQQLADANAADIKVAKDKRDLALTEYHRNLVNASREFVSLADLLDKPEGKGLLPLEEQVQVPFLAADCLFDQGEYNTSLDAYRILADRYPGRLEGLNALGGMVRCYSAMGDTVNMQQRLTEIDALLPKMPKQVQDQWSQWLTVARKPISTP
ncbi:MAG TPA: tetratricopeptide repeat protein [Gemmataceae bacterium]|nr:tetratricopeptide repeat protein [Gemmataceae bacterium]